MGECLWQDAVPTDTGRALMLPNSKGNDHLNQDQTRNVNELNSDKETEGPVGKLLYQESELPLFLRDSSEGQKGDAQDEKDKTGE
jgi:hypothetical protein